MQMSDLVMVSMLAAGTGEFLANPPVVIKNYQITNNVGIITAVEELWAQGGPPRFFSGVGMGVVRKSLANGVVLQTIGPTKSVLQAAWPQLQSNKVLLSLHRRQLDRKLRRGDDESTGPGEDDDPSWCAVLRCRPIGCKTSLPRCRLCRFAQGYHPRHQLGWPCILHACLRVDVPKVHCRPDWPQATNLLEPG